MIAILSSIVVVKVDDEEEAGALAQECDKAALLNWEAALERHGVSKGEVAELMAYLGTSVSVFEELA